MGFTSCPKVSWERFKDWWSGVCSFKPGESPLVPSISTVQSTSKLYPRRDKDELPDRGRAAIMSPMLRVPPKTSYQHPKIRPDPLAYHPVLSSGSTYTVGGVAAEGHRRPSIFQRAQSRQAARDNCLVLNSGALPRCRTGYRTTGQTHAGGLLSFE